MLKDLSESSTMPRSPSEATRFTATGPYASSSPNQPFSQSPSQGSQISFGAPAPENETPQQKIARLRAAAAQAKRSKESQIDKMIRVGRVVADRAHRVTAIGLIGLTVITGMVATAGITDMLIHNRRRRNEWLAEKQVQSARDLREAQEALSRGAATEDQMLLLNRERVAQQSEEARRSKPGMFARAKGWMFGGLEKEERKGGKLGIGAAVEEKREELLGEKEDKGMLQAVEEKVERNRRTAERVAEVVRPLGGPLDRQAEAAARSVEASGKSWTSWITGR